MKRTDADFGVIKKIKQLQAIELSKSKGQISPLALKSFTFACSAVAADHQIEMSM